MFFNAEGFPQPYDCHIVYVTQGNWHKLTTAYVGYCIARTTSFWEFLMAHTINNLQDFFKSNLLHQKTTLTCTKIEFLFTLPRIWVTWERIPWSLIAFLQVHTPHFTLQTLPTTFPKKYLLAFHVTVTKHKPNSDQTHPLSRLNQQIWPS